MSIQNDELEVVWTGFGEEHGPSLSVQVANLEKEVRLLNEAVLILKEQIETGNLDPFWLPKEPPKQIKDYTKDELIARNKLITSGRKAVPKDRAPMPTWEQMNEKYKAEVKEMNSKAPPLAFLAKSFMDKPEQAMNPDPDDLEDK